MTETAQALLYAIGYLNLTTSQTHAVVSGGWHPLYSQTFPKAQFLTPYAGQKALWEKAGHLSADLKTPSASIFMHLPQQSAEADFAIASALSHIQPNGVLMVVADNQTGGKTLSKRLAAFGCPVQDLSKHKCRVVWTHAPQLANAEKIRKALENGDVHARKADGVFTQAGVFSWDRRDVGTGILLQHLPQTLSGKGADLGCGIGEISRIILQQNPDITSLTCIDHDARAIECCSKNLSGCSSKVTFLCQDIPAQTNLTGLDFVVMNPPFHAGKAEDKDLGKAFITKAAAALKPKGTLYMVANAHLPYEDLLRSLFTHGTMVAKENGFKVFIAER